MCVCLFICCSRTDSHLSIERWGMYVSSWRGMAHSTTSTEWINQLKNLTLKSHFYCFIFMIFSEQRQTSVDDKFEDSSPCEYAATNIPFYQYNVVIPSALSTCKCWFLNHRLRSGKSRLATVVAKSVSTDSFLQWALHVASLQRPLWSGWANKPLDEIIWQAIITLTRR